MNLTRKLQAVINIASDNKWVVKPTMSDKVGMKYDFYVIKGDFKHIAFSIFCTGNLHLSKHDTFIYSFVYDELSVLPLLSSMVKNDFEKYCMEIRRMSHKTQEKAKRD